MRKARAPRDRERVHWFTETGAPCGATDAGPWTFAQTAVTCPECLLAMKVATLERRLELYRRSMALTRGRGHRRTWRG